MLTTGALLISFSAVFVKLAHVSPTISGVYRTLIGGVVLIIIILIRDIQSLSSLGAYGVLSQVCGWLLITNGLPLVRSTLAGLIILLQPSLSFIWDILFFNRQTDLYGVIGAYIALAAIY